MMADTRHATGESRRFPRTWAATVCALSLVGLVGCKSNKEPSGTTGVSRGKDPLFAGPGNLIPKQNLAVPDRATGPKSVPDPLTSPAGRRGDKVGYTDDPDRFKGTYIQGKPSTPAALAGRFKDGEELKIDEGVPLTPAGGTLPGGALEPPAEVAPLYAELTKLGVKRENCSLTRENGKWVFLASVLQAPDGPKTQYSGTADNPAEAVKQVLKQLR